MIRVLVVDDHPIVRQGVIAIITGEEEIQVVAEAASGEEGVTMHAEHRPDVTLMDLQLPGMSGVDAIRAIRAATPDARFIVLTTFDGDEDIYRALQAGAQGYVLKDTFCDQILDAIRAVAAGGSRVPDHVAQRLVERMPKPALSPREVDVLRLISQGKSNKEIGAALRIGEGTVKSHVVSILEKLGADDRTAAVMIALQRGIIHF